MEPIQVAVFSAWLLTLVWLSWSYSGS